MKLGITMLINNKDDIQFVTEFPCFLGHPVVNMKNKLALGQIIVRTNDCRTNKLHSTH